jgi:hypothetical protein
MNKWVVDRIEEGMAVLENTESRESIVCPAADLPEGVKEGGSLIQKQGRKMSNAAGKGLLQTERCSEAVFIPDTSEETAARSRRIREKMDRLKKKDR